MLEFLGLDRTGKREVWRNPSWEDVLRALDLLDGREVTMLTLAADERTFLTVAGGAGGLYVAGAALASGRFAALVEPARTGAAVPVALARQRQEMAPEMAVSRDAVQRAALRFYRSATLDPELTWVFSEEAR